MEHRDVDDRYDRVSIATVAGLVVALAIAIWIVIGVMEPNAGTLPGHGAPVEEVQSEPAGGAVPAHP